MSNNALWICNYVQQWVVCNKLVMMYSDSVATYPVHTDIKTLLKSSVLLYSYFFSWTMTLQTFVHQTLVTVQQFVNIFSNMSMPPKYFTLGKIYSPHMCMHTHSYIHIHMHVIAYIVQILKRQELYLFMFFSLVLFCSPTYYVDNHPESCRKAYRSRPARTVQSISR